MGCCPLSQTNDAELPREFDDALDRLARKVVNRRLEAAVQFFLEAHLPFVTIFHTAGLLFEPIATPLFGAERVHSLNRLFSDRKNVEELLRRIEIYSIARDGQNKKR